jgi:hypothetical protein
MKLEILKTRTGFIFSKKEIDPDNHRFNIERKFFENQNKNKERPIPQYMDTLSS